MKKFTTFALLSALIMVFTIQSAFAGPFGIDMGMSLAQVSKVCKTAPKRLEANVYEIVPPKTNDMFERYLVRIDPDHGVYWLKAIGKDVYTNGHGEDLISKFEILVTSICKTYGEELYRIDSLKADSYFAGSENFMYTLEKGDRELKAIWSKLGDGTILLTGLLNDPKYKDRVVDCMAKSDTTTLKTLIKEKMLSYKQLPDDIDMIGVFADAVSSTMGYVALEYSFSNYDAVQAKNDSVF